jgi:hypothetical protein
MERCARCDNCRWVCENHTDRPWLGARPCGCGGAGATCPVCNAAERVDRAEDARGLPGRRGEQAISWRINENGRQPRRPYYLRRLRSHASLISKTTIVTMVVTTIGPANIATSVSIFQRGGWRPGEESHSCICEAVSACRAWRMSLSRITPCGVPRASLRRRSACSLKR